MIETTLSSYINDMVMTRIMATGESSRFQIQRLQGPGMHNEVNLRIQALLEDEDDWVVAMATVACELHHAFEHFH